jgi:hypothetical protein
LTLRIIVKAGITGIEVLTEISLQISGIKLLPRLRLFTTEEGIGTSRTLYLSKLALLNTWTIASMINSSAPFNPRSLAAKIILLAVGE